MKALASLALAGLIAVAFTQHVRTKSFVYTRPITAPGVRNVVELQLAKYVQAMNSKDVKGLQAVLTPGFTAVAGRRTTKGSEIVTQMTQVFKVAKKTHLSATILYFKLVGGNADVMCHNVADLEFPSGKGKTVKYHSDTKVEQTWVPSGGTYKMRLSRELSGTKTMDGKPIPGRG